MACEVTKQLAAQVTGNADEGMACDPTGESPQQIVGGDQRYQNHEGEPHGITAWAGRERVDQEFHTILRAY